MAAGTNSETGVELLARLGAKPSLTTLQPQLFPDGPSQRDVIEICGGDGCGKTEFLLNVICQCILPPSWRDRTIGGLGVGALYIDTDCHFSMLRLTTILEHRIGTAVSQNKTVSPSTSDDVSDAQLESFMKECLKKLYVVRCHNSIQLITTLYSLETLLSNQPEICLLMIDSISAFYWLDRSNGADSISAQEVNQRRIVQILQKLVLTYNLVVFATKQAIFQKRAKTFEKMDSSVSNESPSSSGAVSEKKPENYFEFMSKDWQKFVTKHIAVTRIEGKAVNPSRQEYSAVYQFTWTDSKGKHSQGFRIKDTGISFEDT